MVTLKKSGNNYFANNKQSERAIEENEATRNNQQQSDRFEKSPRNNESDHQCWGGLVFGNLPPVWVDPLHGWDQKQQIEHEAAHYTSVILHIVAVSRSTNHEFKYNPLLSYLVQDRELTLVTTPLSSYLLLPDSLLHAYCKLTTLT